MDKFREEAEKWVQSPGSAFTLNKVNEEARELVFDGKLPSNSTINFKILNPNSDHPDHFVVTSEDEHTNLRLFEINDTLAMKKGRTLSQTLSMIQANLCTETDIEEDQTDDSGEESEDFDDEDVGNFIDDGGAAAAEAVTSNPHQSNIPDDEYDTKLNIKYNGCSQPKLAVARLMSDFKQLKKSAREINFGISAGPRGDNLFLWDVKLTDFDSKSKLGMDMVRYAKRYNEEPALKLEMEFPSTYPMEPPFLRVLKPRFEFLTGHVTIGGSICMELLTRSGWSPSNDIESILVQVRAEIMSDTNARLHKNPNVEYSALDAKNAFKRMTQKYGWN